MRTEFGFERTVSTTKMDIECCKRMPGFLVPADLERLAEAFGLNPIEFAKRHLLASPGALVIFNGKMRRVPTLVPDRDPRTGHCKFFRNDLCTIHAVAPYGCSFFDYDMDDDEGRERSLAGTEAVMKAWDDDDGYAALWYILNMVGRHAPGPEECRKHLSHV